MLAWLLVVFLFLIVLALTGLLVFGAIRFLALQKEEKLAKASSEEHYEARLKLQRLYESLKQYKPILDIDLALQDRKKKYQQILHKLEQKKVLSEKEAQQIVKVAEAEAKKHMDASRIEAEAGIDRAKIEANKIVTRANVKAEEIAGDAYKALKNKVEIENATRAMRNIIKGYGDEYIVPSSSVLDDLSEEWGHKEAGAELKKARTQSKKMVTDQAAADCDYVESSRKETAIRFVIDAFNGRVDAILSGIKHNNLGTLEQKIRDVYAIVNENGKAFKNARILESYLEARLEELRWGVSVQELRKKDQEEQKRIREEIREEERVRKEIEKAQKEAKREEESLNRALETLQTQMAEATESQRHEYEMKLAQLEKDLHEAHEKNRRAVSMAQQTRQGHVYVISNIGSFGKDVFKIGMTRRIEPMDRVKELGDASVPFPFDVHAMLHSTDAPSLERDLQTYFEARQLNQVNPRKEFFSVTLSEIKEVVEKKGIQSSWTMRAEATEYRESLAIQEKTGNASNSLPPS
ncbi:MAG: DUF4041 domain-containing protein [Pirellulaceae bacterium]|nr:DUF4041 domain-containing protein [Pirellulaceae bacterium]